MSRVARALGLRAEDLAAGLAGAAFLLPVELYTLLVVGRMKLGLWAVVGLFAGLGLGVGVALSAGQTLAVRWASSLWMAALIRALPSLIVTVPVASTLFQGAWASTLPGAGLAFIWLPALALFGLSLVIYAGIRHPLSPGIRAALGLGLPAAALCLDAVNRRTLSSEYPDMHTALLVLCCVLAGLGLRFFANRFAPRAWRRSRHWPTGPAALRTLFIPAGLFLVAVAGGLGDKGSRRAVADSGMHARLLTRSVSALFDLDHDGFTAVLGGRDCDDLDPAVFPGAEEIIGNGVDEDCDGVDLKSPFALPVDNARRTRLAQWRGQPEVQSFVRRAGKMNVVMLVVDALRADTFMPVPANIKAFPNLFRLRERSRWFNRAFAPAAGTDLSMAGVLSGKVDPISGVEVTVPEALTAAGYLSYAVIPGEVLRSASKTLLTRGLAGHQVLVTDPYQRNVADDTSSELVTDLGLKFIDQEVRGSQSRFFLWLHYFDVHEHHQIPPGISDIVAHNGGRVPQTLTEGYRALTSVVDEAVGKLMTGLARRGLAEDTIIILLADHGESLREDPRLPQNHGRFLYNPLVHVPLAIMVPGLAPAEVAQPVGLLDLPATIFDLVGANVARQRIQGESLLPYLLDGGPTLSDPHRILPLNETDQFGVIMWPHKLLVRPGANITELYDLSRDFAEQTDLADARPDLVRQLLGAYRAFPAVYLDRTLQGRRRWDNNARPGRPPPLIRPGAGRAPPARAR